MTADVNSWESRTRAHPVGRVAIELAWGASLLATLGEVAGWAAKGLRFLGQFGRHPWLALALLVAVGLPLWCRGARALLRSSALPCKRRGLAVSALLLHVAVVALLASQVLRYDIVHAEEGPATRLVVAVAEFGAGPDLKRDAAGREVSAYLRPAIAGEVAVRSVGLVADQATAQRVAQASGAQVLLWGWVTGDARATLAPTLLFVDLTPGLALDLCDTPPWYDTEISGEGRLELGQLAGERAAALVQYTLGLMYLHDDDYAAAAHEFRAAIAGVQADDAASARTLATLQVALGRTLVAQDEVDAAREAYQAASETDPDYVVSYLGLGNVAYADGQYAEALRQFEQAIALAPQRAASWYMRGNARYQLGEYALAAEDYLQAIQRAADDDPRRPLFHHALGNALCLSGRAPEGLEQLATAAALARAGSDLALAAQHATERCATTATPLPTSAPTASALPTAAATPSPSQTATRSSTVAGATSPTSPSPSATPSRAPSAATAVTRTSTDTPPPTPTPPSCTLRLTCDLSALQRDGRTDWNEVVVECVDADEKVLARVGLTGVETALVWPTGCTALRLWIGPGLGGAQWWERWRCTSQPAAPLVELCIEPVTLAQPSATRSPTAFVPPPSPSSSPVADPTQAPTSTATPAPTATPTAVPSATATELPTPTPTPWSTSG
jgi:tetratricopeptide (TPR) repeat protein